MRKIAFITTARSDYNTMYPVMKLAQQDPDIHHLHYVCGMHLLDKFGQTWKTLVDDGLNPLIKIDFLSEVDTPESFASNLGDGVSAFVRQLSLDRPDIICVSGDRIENLSLYIAATVLKIPVAHMCGGDITEGALDNQVRHVMTKLSHIHFVSMPEHHKRVLQLGEDPSRIFTVGDAALDTFANFVPFDKSYIADNLGFPHDAKFFIVAFHPQTLGSDNFILQYRNLLSAISDYSSLPIMIYPNIDPGFSSILSNLEDFLQQRTDAVARSSFPRDFFYSLLCHAEFIIGNSSCGLWEAPSFRLPSINIGDRQAGRIRASNVVDVTGLDIETIRQAIRHVTSQSFLDTLSDIVNPYGNGIASPAIIATLKSISLGDNLLTKSFFDIADSPLLNLVSA